VKRKRVNARTIAVAVVGTHSSDGDPTHLGDLVLAVNNSAVLNRCVTRGTRNEKGTMKGW
jgi:hypothetical protein